MTTFRVLKNEFAQTAAGAMNDAIDRAILHGHYAMHNPRPDYMKERRAYLAWKRGRERFVSQMGYTSP